MTCLYCGRQYGLSDFGPWVQVRADLPDGIVTYKPERTYSYARGLCIVCHQWCKGPFVSGAPQRQDDERDCKGK